MAEPPPLPKKPPTAPPSKRIFVRKATPRPFPSPAVPPVDAPVPTEDGVMSKEAKLSLAEIALHLRDEQLQARVTHYKAELETSPELDAVTARVVAELHALQAARDSSMLPAPSDPRQRELELTHSLKEMLSRIFRRGRMVAVIERKMAEASKRFAVLFFESELAEKIHGSAELKTIHFPEQALFWLFTRAESLLIQELESYEYANAKVRNQAREQLEGVVVQLRNTYLARTTPELNNLVKILNEVLFRFFTNVMPASIDELATKVVREASLGHARMRATYKISAESFSSFRETFERHFMQRLVAYAEDELLARVREREDKFRNETLRFVADPRIFSDVCELVCEATYDFLYNDGFLDLPTDWRASLARPEISVVGRVP